MTQIITIVQLVAAVLLVGAILMQRRGSGLSGTFGGNDSNYSTRRGAEKIIFQLTIVLAIVFVVASVARIII